MTANTCTDRSRHLRLIGATLVLALLAPLGALTSPAPAGAVENGPDPTVESIGTDGPYATASSPIPTPVSGFGGGVIHRPLGAPGETFGAVVIAPGFLGSSANYAWMGPRLASHGFVVLLMDTLARTDLPPSRGQQILAALDHLTEQSSVASVVDPERLAVAGHSMGGGGVLEAASVRPSLKAAMAFQPWHTTKSWPAIEVPTLIVGAEDDAVAPVATHAIPFYESLAAAREHTYLELADTPHSASTAGHPVQARYMVTWLKRFVDDDARYEPFLCPNPGTSGEISDYRDSCPTGEPAAPTTVSGRVTGPDGSPVEDVWVMAYTDEDTWVGSQWAFTGDDGSYAIVDLPPGSYRLRFAPPGDAGLVAEWYDDAASRATASLVTVEPGTAVAGIDAELAEAGSVSGTVTGPDGAPAPGVTVALYADTDKWVGTASTTTGPDGTYTLHGVPTGTYRILFTPPTGAGLQGEWHDDQATRGGATPATVEPGTPLTIDAMLAAAAPPPAGAHAASAVVHAVAAAA